MDKHISKHRETQHLASDVVHYREYKILLQPDRFTSKHGFLEFWETASKTLKKLGLKVDVDRHAFDSQVREVLFYDTPEFDLFNHHFILRKRTFYDQGWPRPGHELTFEALVQFLMDKEIAKFKLPERLEVMDDFPVSTFGKVSKKALVEMVAEKLGAEV